MTVEEYRAAIRKKKKRRNKYGNKKVEVDGHKFDSKLEAQYYNHLKLLIAAGEVTEIELQPRFELQEGFNKNGVRHRPIHYVADFRVKYKDGKEEIVDVKGRETAVFKIKHKLFEYKYKDLELKIVKKGDF